MKCDVDDDDDGGGGGGGGGGAWRKTISGDVFWIMKRASLPMLQATNCLLVQRHVPNNRRREDATREDKK